MTAMPRAMPILIPAMLLLAACTPATTGAASAPIVPVAPTSAATTPPPAESVATVSTSAAMPPAAGTPAADSTRASAGQGRISGAIRDGNRPPPALRVCATPVGGGTPTCIETQQGSRDYQIDVTPGRYYLLGLRN